VSDQQTPEEIAAMCMLDTDRGIDARIAASGKVIQAIRDEREIQQKQVERIEVYLDKIKVQALEIKRLLALVRSFGEEAELLKGEKRSAQQALFEERDTWNGRMLAMEKPYRARIATLEDELAAAKMPEAGGDAPDAWTKLRDALEASEARLLRAEKLIERLLATGLNGGNNVRLSFMAASRKVLDAAALAQADASETAVVEARAFLKPAPQSTAPQEHRQIGPEDICPRCGDEWGVEGHPAKRALMVYSPADEELRAAVRVLLARKELPHIVEQPAPPAAPEAPLIEHPFILGTIGPFCIWVEGPPSCLKPCGQPLSAHVQGAK